MGAILINLKCLQSKRLKCFGERESTPKLFPLFFIPTYKKFNPVSFACEFVIWPCAIFAPFPIAFMEYSFEGHVISSIRSFALHRVVMPMT